MSKYRLPIKEAPLMKNLLEEDLDPKDLSEKEDLAACRLAAISAR